MQAVESFSADTAKVRVYVCMCVCECMLLVKFIEVSSGLTQHNGRGTVSSAV